jgi:hypothetical protein
MDSLIPKEVFNNELVHDEIQASGIGYFCKHPRCLWPETEHFDSLKPAIEHFADEVKLERMEVANTVVSDLLDVYEQEHPSTESYVKLIRSCNDYARNYSVVELESLIRETLPKD